MASILRVKDKDGNTIEIPAIKGDPGKTAYEYAKEGGYTGTEEEFKGLMAAVRTEEWVFVLEDGTEVKKKVYAG